MAHMITIDYDDGRETDVFEVDDIETHMKRDVRPKYRTGEIHAHAFDIGDTTYTIVGIKKRTDT